MGLPPAVKIALSSLDSTRQKAFRQDYSARKKSIIIAYLCWLFLGWHYLYQGKTGMQFAFWFTLGGFGAWWLFDALRVPSMISEYNDDLARALMAEHKALAV